MAEFVMKELDKGESLHIESRATSSWEHGNPVHQGTQKILRKYAISFDSSKGSQQISRADFEFFDLVVGMDESNVEDLLQISAGHYDDKIKLFRPGAQAHHRGGHHGLHQLSQRPGPQRGHPR